MSEANGAESNYHLPSLLYCMDYIDTQGMSIPSTGNDVTVEYKPTHFKKLSAFTDMEREELKQMFREVLDEYC